MSESPRAIGLMEVINAVDPVGKCERCVPERAQYSRIAGFSKLCSDIYLAARSPDRWADALLGIRNYFDAEYVILTWHGKPDFPGRYTLASPRPSDPLRREYAETYLSKDPLSQVSPGVLRTTYESDIGPLWRRYYETYGSRYDCHHGLAAGFAAESQERYTFRLFRREGAPDFSSEDLVYFQAVVTQMEQAVSWQKDWICMRAEKNSFGAALDDLSVPSMVLDAQGYVISATQSAQWLWENVDGPVYLQDQRVQLRQAQHQLQFLKTMAHASRHPSKTAAMQCSMPGVARRWTLVVHAIPDTNGVRGSPAWMLMWRNSQEKTRLDGDLLRNVFQFTAAETRLAEALMSGATLQEVCVAVGIRIPTARSHLRAIFRKTDVQRQVELIQLLRHFGERQASSV